MSQEDSSSCNSDLQVNKMSSSLPEEIEKYLRYLKVTILLFSKPKMSIFVKVHIEARCLFKMNIVAQIQASYGTPKPWNTELPWNSRSLLGGWQIFSNTLINLFTNKCKYLMSSIPTISLMCVCDDFSFIIPMKRKVSFCLNSNFQLSKVFETTEVLFTLFTMTTTTLMFYLLF